MVMIEITYSSFVNVATTAAADTVQIDWLAQLQQGGFVVIIQAFLVVALIAISLERFLSLKRQRFVPEGYAADAATFISSGAELGSSSEGHTIGRATAFLVEHANDRSAALDGVRDLAQREIEVEHEKLASLSLIAAAAPLLGLLGTMIGMIESFQLVALYGDEGGASMLAGSIAKALITTAVGLVIALPALFLHHIFKRKLQRITKVLEADLEVIHRAWLKMRGSNDQDEA